jgi:hypothetical protein
MEIPITKDELVDLFGMLDELHAKQLLTYTLLKKGIETSSDKDKAELKQQCYEISKMMFKLSDVLKREGRFNSSPEKDVMMKKIFNEFYKEEISLDTWWGERFSGTSPQIQPEPSQSNSSSLKKQTGESTPEQE